jgi:nicotinamidase-related amidase
LGYPIGAISDYIAMLTLSQLRLTDGCGVLPNSVEATVRMAGNLGFRTYLVADACFTFARRDYHGRLRTADEVHSMSLANLHDEYCIVLDTASVLADS